MPEKRAVIEVLEEEPLLLPELLHEAAGANARIKYWLSLLQMAGTQAESPEAQLPSPEAERKRCGIDDGALDGLPASSHLRPGGLFHIPGVRKVVERIGADLDRMLRPLRVASPGEVERAAGLERRIEALRLEDATLGPDTIAPGPSRVRQRARRRPVAGAAARNRSGRAGRGGRPQRPAAARARLSPRRVDRPSAPPMSG